MEACEPDPKKSKTETDTESLPQPPQPSSTNVPSHPAGSIDGAIPKQFIWAPNSMAVVMIDWQLDFTRTNGFGALLGNDVTPLQEALAPAAAVLQAGRKYGAFIVHTLESHVADLSDCPPAKLARCPCIGTVMDKEMGRVLIRGEPGNGLEDNVAPLEGELVVYKPGKGAFWNTELEVELQSRGVKSLVFTGVTTEVCVQTTMREANDRGFECIVVEEATASYIPRFKESALDMISSQGGIVGWRCKLTDVLKALEKPPSS